LRMTGSLPTLTLCADLTSAGTNWSSTFMNEWLHVIKITCWQVGCQCETYSTDEIYANGNGFDFHLRDGQFETRVGYRLHCLKIFLGFFSSSRPRTR
jgi:hypothetical protein